MPPENYRYYRLDGAGQLNVGRWFIASDDEDAVSQIQANHPDDRCEIWQGTRLVAELNPKCLNPDDPARQDAVAARLSVLAGRMRRGLET